MAFKGTLREFKVPDILQLISLQKKTGILTFNSQEGFITLIFEDGFIIGIDAFPKKLEMRVGNVFVKQEIISEEMLQRALSIQKRTNQKVGEILIGMGLIDEKIIPEVLKIQATQIVLSLFNWKKGEYNFKVLDYVDKELRLLAPIAVDNLIMEGVQMLDEWPLIKKVIPSEDIVFEPVFLGSKKIALISEYDDDLQSKDSNTLYLTETEVNLLKHINGKNTVKDIVELGLFTEYKIYKNLFNLFNKGLMKKKEKTEIQEIREKKVFEDLEHENARKLSRLSQFLLVLLALLLLLTFFTPLRPFHKKNMLLKTQLYRDNLPSDPARALTDNEIPQPPGKAPRAQRGGHRQFRRLSRRPPQDHRDIGSRPPGARSCWPWSSPFIPIPRALLRPPHPTDQHRPAAPGDPEAPGRWTVFFSSISPAWSPARPATSSTTSCWTPCA